MLTYLANGLMSREAVRAPRLHPAQGREASSPMWRGRRHLAALPKVPAHPLRPFISLFCEL